MPDTNPTSNETLREQITVIFANAITSGKSIAELRRIPLRDLKKSDDAIDKLMQLLLADRHHHIALAQQTENERWKKLMRDRNAIKPRSKSQEDHSACIDVFDIDKRIAEIEKSMESKKDKT